MGRGEGGLGGGGEEEVAPLRCHCCSGGGGDANDNVRGRDQDMLYSNADALSHDRRQAEGGKSNVDNGSNKEHVNGRVWGPRWAYTRDGQRQSLRCNV